MCQMTHCPPVTSLVCSPPAVARPRCACGFCRLWRRLQRNLRHRRQNPHTTACELPTAVRMQEKCNPPHFFCEKLPGGYILAQYILRGATVGSAYAV